MIQDDERPLLQSPSEEEFLANEEQPKKETVNSDSSCPTLVKNRKKLTILWISLMAILSLILVVILILYLFVLPKIINQAVEDTEIKIISSFMHSPQKDSCQVTMDISIKNPTGWAISLSKMNVEIMEEEEKVFGVIEMPEISLSQHELKPLSFSSSLRIVNEDNFKKFLNNFMTKPVLTWILKSTTAITPAIFPLKVSGIEFVKSFQLNGFDNLKQVEIQKFDLPANNDRGIAVELETKIVNPSVMGVALGQADFDVYFDSVIIGYSSVPCLNITMGDNYLSLSGGLIPVTNSKADAVSTLFNNYVSGKPSKLKVRGNPSNNSQEAISWVNYLVANIQMDITLPGIIGFSPIERIDLIKISSDFSDKDSFPTRGMLGVLYKMPFKFPLSLVSVASSMHLEKDEKPLADINFSNSPVVKNDPGYAEVKFEGNMMPRENFPNFLENLILSDKVIADSHGKTDIVALTNIGMIKMKEMRLEKELTIKGIASFSDPAPVVNNISVFQGDEAVLFMAVNVTLNNPSPFEAFIGNTSLDIVYKDEKLGEASIKNFSLKMGNNTVVADCFENALTSNSPAAEEFFSNYATGKNSIVQLKGTAKSVDNPIFQAVFEKLSVVAEFPGIPKDQLLIKSAVVGPMGFLDFRPGGGFHLVNVFDVEVTVLGMTDVQIFHMPDKYNSTDFLLATIDQPELKPTYVVKPRSELKPGKKILLNVNHSNPIDLLKELFGMTDTIYVRVKGKVIVKLGKYPVTLNYYQESIPSKFSAT